MNIREFYKEYHNTEVVNDDDCKFAEAYAKHVVDEKNRPTVKEIFAEKHDIKTVHNEYTNSPNLFRYAQALDEFIDKQIKRIEGKPKITDDDEGVESCMNCGKYFYQIGNEALCSRCYTLT